MEDVTTDVNESGVLDRQIVKVSKDVLEAVKQEINVDRLIRKRIANADNANFQSKHYAQKKKKEEDDESKKFRSSVDKVLRELSKENRESRKSRQETLNEYRTWFINHCKRMKQSRELTDKNCKDLQKLCNNGWEMTRDIKLPVKYREMLAALDVLDP